MITIDSHVREIERVTAGADSGRDPAVVQSWLRCVNDYKLDPADAQDAYIVPEAKLREHQAQAEDIIRISRSGVASLFEQVSEQNYVVMLADARGVTVDYLGHPRLDSQLRQAGLYLGAEWSENRAGTSAMGACLVSGEPVTIHQDDHFDPTHIGLTCTAAPIFDTLGELVAVLDISQLRSPESKTSQQLALHLTRNTARRIELANLVARARREWVLRLSQSPDFIDIDPDAAVSLDARGRISGVTHGGLGALARATGLRFDTADTLIGQPISRFFDIGIDDLPQYMRGQSAGERVLNAGGEPALFASAISPAAPRRRGVRTPPPAEPSPALAALSHGDEAMAALQRRAARLAVRDIPILIQGETGTGKEWLARAIHDTGRAEGRFVAVNCAALPEQLIESELFGYVPNAFTGADRRGKTGLIAAADGGTLFLDEIGDMPLALQTRLLRVLSEGEVTPVGGLEPKPVRLRLISATHRALADHVAAGRFREDLYYRLNAATLRLPALRDRRDFDALVDRMLEGLAERYDARYRLAPSARRALSRHHWPGNLRELQNSLDVAAALADEGLIGPDELPETVRDSADRDTALARRLADHGGNVSALARSMGVDRSTIHRRLKRGAG